MTVTRFTDVSGCKGHINLQKSDLYNLERSWKCKMLFTFPVMAVLLMCSQLTQSKGAVIPNNLPTNKNIGHW